MRSTFISVAPLWHDGYVCSIDVHERADIEGLGPRQLASVLGELDVARRRIEAMIAETAGLANEPSLRDHACLAADMNIRDALSPDP